MPTILERIGAGEFSNSVGLPKRRLDKTGLDEYRKAMQAYWSGERVIRFRFMQAVLDDVGLTSHPNAEQIFEYAWGNGHSTGLYEVYRKLCDLADLFYCKGKLLVKPEE